MSNINFGEILSHYSFKSCFCLILSFSSGIPIVISYNLCNCTNFLDILFWVCLNLVGGLFFFFFFSLCFSVLEVPVVTSSSSEILPSVMSNPLTNFTFLHVRFYLFFISFSFFLKISIFLLTLSICSHALSAFSIKDLSIFVMVLFFNSNIPAVSDSGSDACSVSSSCLLPFSVPCNSLLKSRHEVLDKKNCSK